MVANRNQVGKIRPQDRVNLGEKAIRVALIVQVALMKHDIGTLVFDQRQDRFEIGAMTRVADKGHLEVRGGL